MKASREEHDAGTRTVRTVNWINFLFFLRLSFLSISLLGCPMAWYACFHFFVWPALLHVVAHVCCLLSPTFYTWARRDKESLGDDMQRVSHVGTTTDRKIHTRNLKHQRPERTARGFHSFWLLLNACHVLWFISFRLPLLFQGYKFISKGGREIIFQPFLGSSQSREMIKPVWCYQESFQVSLSGFAEAPASCRLE